jgi:hypothetical protein
MLLVLLIYALMFSSLNFSWLGDIYLSTSLLASILLFLKDLPVILFRDPVEAILTFKKLTVRLKQSFILKYHNY